MDDSDLLRYGRQILLPEIGIEGQQRLNRATALVMGLGGLGSAAALYLAASGLGRLALCDPDRVELSNLQRQIVHRHADIGRLKTESAAQTLHALAPQLECTLYPARLAGADLHRAVAEADVVLDCMDNFDSRFALNAACVAEGRTLVSAAAIRWEAQISVLDPAAGGPCYQCLYPPGPDSAEPCAERGVISPLVGIIGAMQALEAIKLLCAVGRTLAGRLLLFDGLHGQFRELRVQRDPACPVCGVLG